MMTAKRNGILAAGNFIVDRVKMIDAYPEQDTLAHIFDEYVSNGGGPYNILKNLAALGVLYPLSACGVVGDDANGHWVLRDCSESGIGTAQLSFSSFKPTSYTDAMTVRDTGRRTFFHQRGANDLFDLRACDLGLSQAKLFYLGYLLLLGGLDIFDTEGRSEASKLLEAASRQGMVTAVDLVSAQHPQYRELVRSALPYTDHLLLNELEAAKVLGLEVQRDPEGMLDSAKRILAEGVRETVTIHSSQGAVSVSREGQQAVQAALALSKDFIAGASGAGDAFAAGYLHGVHEAMSLEDALYLATCTAAASLSHPSPSGGVLLLEACLELGERFGTVSGFALRGVAKLDDTIHGVSESRLVEKPSRS